MMTGTSLDLDVATAHQMMADRSARLIDVREIEEWDAGHIAESQHMPLASLGGHMKEVSGVGCILVICRTGSRSSRAAEVLRASGIDARNVLGGVQAWKQAGLPLVAADGQPGLVI
jgi:rhodanese-related sulfurtransferase